MEAKVFFTRRGNRFCLNKWALKLLVFSSASLFSISMASHFPLKSDQHFCISIGNAAFADPPASTQGLPDIASLFDAQKGKVVSVTTEVASPQTPFSLFDMFGNGEQQTRIGQGSGFIVDPAGYVITNYHVIKGANSIAVSFENHETYPADIVGYDPNIDIALLKLRTTKRFPSVKLGHSENLKVGQWVVAIGNPFGLDSSVTAGIISAKGRRLGTSPYDNFLQTDASINPGNSGGPLFDMNGEVVGVNTAIIRNGNGIGFAVPIDMVKAILPQLQKRGHVERGYLGIEIEPNYQSIGGQDQLLTGIKVHKTVPYGPADKAGLKQGDIIEQLDGKNVTSTQSFMSTIVNMPPSSVINLLINRQGQRMRIPVILGIRPGANRPGPSTGPQQLVPLPPSRSMSTTASKEYGLATRSLTPDERQANKLPANVGVRVTSTFPSSLVANILQKGDIITNINGQSVATPKDVDSQLATSKNIFRMQILRDGETMYLGISIQ